MELRGKVFKFGDDISTDHVIPGRFFHLRSNIPELAKHTLEDVNPKFAASVKQGDFIVAGKNFGLGSSREHAPLVLKTLGVSAVLVKSAARIFFRNAINIGLPVLVCDTTRIDQGDDLLVNLTAGTVNNINKGEIIRFVAFPTTMLKILSEGGLLPYINKYGDFIVDT